MAETTTFTNRGGVELAARIDLPPDDAPRAFVLLAHCFTCSKDLTAHRRIARSLTGVGLGVMSFDFTGLGASGGDFADTTFSSQASDLVDAAEHLANVYEAPSFLVGHSLGGTACLYAARELPAVRGVATIGAPAEPAHVEKLFAGDVEEIEAAGEARVSIGGRPFTIRKRFVDDIRNHPPERWIRELKVDLLILHSPVDTVVGIENAERKGLPLESVTVHLSHEKVHATDGAACGEEAQGATQGAGAGGSGGGRSQKIDRIERVLELDGDLTDEQRDRLVEIADKCPVHRTLTTPTVVETRLG